MAVLSSTDLRRMYPESPFIGPASIDLHIGDSMLWWPEWIRRDPRIDQAHLWRNWPIENPHDLGVAPRLPLPGCHPRAHQDPS
jgi:hypothetical protein